MSPITKKSRREITMHDIRKIKENPIEFDKLLSRRHHRYVAQEILKLDAERRAKILESETAQAERNSVSNQVKQAKLSNNLEEFENLRTLLSNSKSNIRGVPHR